MTMSSDDRDSLETLEARLRSILPDEYQDTYEEVQPVSMGSAGMRYDVDGRVAWNEMWATFCDLAMAGGPPHKGTLLEPASPAQIASQPDRYAQVVEEISRGIRMVTDLTPELSPIPGWVRVDCLGEGMAGWLLRAIVMENVSARADGTALDLPAGPDYRLEKEIKNVITVIAKTCHYWEGHMWRAEQRFVAELFATIAVESPLLQPFLSGDGVRVASHQEVFARMAERIRRDTGLPSSSHQYAGWLGVECQSVRAAVWMMRAMVASNILSRREGAVLFVPFDPVADPTGDIVVRTVARLQRFAIARDVL